MADDSTSGKRGRGRPVGSLNKITQEARLRAMEQGDLPHEFLLRVSRGELIKTKVVDEDGVITFRYDQPDLDKRIDAAKAAAPYYAPKLATVELITGISDDDLDQLIAESASAAGFSLTAGGEGQADPGTDGEPGSNPAPQRTRRRVE